MRTRSIRFIALVSILSSSLVACGGGDSTTPGNEVTDTGSGADTSTGTDSGGSDDTGTPDTGTVTDDTGGDGGTAFDCTGKADGTACGGGSICIKGVCGTSTCGDGYVDTAGGEDCEDGNTVSGDGCSSCKFDCKTNPDCDNGATCDGTETCDTTTHKCAAGTAASDGTSCSLGGGTSGTCKGGACLAAGCGNGVKEGSEECDDGNTDDTDGCTKFCKYTCSADADCDDGNKCNGTETCNTTTHRCSAGTAVTCSPKTGCTGTCDPTSGACTYPDADKDGVACDKDCNDADPAMFPGAYECKDGKDNDCSAATSDSTAPSCVCYADPDRDGYAATGAPTISSSATCPDGYTRRAPTDATTSDCGTYNASANPGQTGWFTSPYCKYLVLPGGSCPIGGSTFDYNCSGAEEKRYSVSSSTSCPGATTLFGCLIRSGWIGSVPACGGSGTYRQCSWSTTGCSGAEVTKKQECH